MPDLPPLSARDRLRELAEAVEDVLEGQPAGDVLAVLTRMMAGAIVSTGLPEPDLRGLTALLVQQLQDAVAKERVLRTGAPTL